MTYEIDVCRLSLPRLVLGINRIGKDWLAQCQDNVTEWDIGLWCQWPDVPEGQHYEVAMSTLSRVDISTDVALDVCKDIKLEQPTSLLNGHLMFTVAYRQYTYIYTGMVLSTNLH